MSKKRNKATALLGAAAFGAAAFGITVYLSSRLLVKTALERELPSVIKKHGNKISGTDEKNDEFDIAKAVAARRLRKLPHENVKIVSRDNIELVGHFFPAKNAKRLIIAFHGWRSSWDRDFAMLADFFEKTGSSVLYAEQRGQNQSGGNYMGFGLTERFDVKGWTEWAAEKCGRNFPIYLVGASMGATTVLMASSLDFSANIRGIAADSGFTSPKEIWEHVAKHNVHLYTAKSSVADAVCKRMINVGSGDFSTEEALRQTTIPVLFIHGDADKFVPVEMTYRNYEACASEKRMLIVSGAGHVMSCYNDKAAYEKTLTDFFAEFD